MHEWCGVLLPAEAVTPAQQKGVLYKLKSFQRRTKHSFIKATQTVEETVDPQYDRAFQHTDDIDRRSLNLQRCIDNFLKAQQRFLEEGEALSQALFDLYDETPGGTVSPLRDVAAGLYDLQIQSSRDVLPGLVSQWQMAVLGPVDRMQGRLETIKQDHARRQRYVADYDYYRCKDRRIADDPGVPEAKKDDCRSKLYSTKERFGSLNANLIERMGAAAQHKDALVDETLLSVVALLRALHEQSGARLAALDQLSDTEASRQAARRSKELLDQFELDTQIELQERALAPSSYPPMPPPQRRDITPLTPTSPLQPNQTHKAVSKGALTSTSGSIGGAWSAGATAAEVSAQGGGATMVRAMFEYVGTTETELDLAEGDIVTVLKQDPSGWWQGEVDGRIGWFPFNYVQVVGGT